MTDDILTLYISIEIEAALASAYLRGKCIDVPTIDIVEDDLRTLPPLAEALLANIVKLTQLQRTFH